MLLSNFSKQNCGFTLTETIVTVIIIGILAAVAAPNLLGLLYQSRVAESLAQVKGAVKEAQRQAIRKGKTCKIKLDEITLSGENRERVTTVTTTDEPGSNYSECLTSDRILPQGVSLDSNIPGIIDKITFSPKGNTTTSGTIKLSASSNSIKKCLVISNGLGIIRTGIYDEKISGSWAKKCQTD